MDEQANFLLETQQQQTPLPARKENVFDKILFTLREHYIRVIVVLVALAIAAIVLGLIPVYLNGRMLFFFF